MQQPNAERASPLTGAAVFEIPSTEVRALGSQQRLFASPEEFASVSGLAIDWQEIRNEYFILSQQSFCVPDPSMGQYIGDWKWIPLLVFECWAEKILQHTPRTYEILKEKSGIVNAGFSILNPGVEILPHVDSYPDLWRYHLCLQEAPDCALIVGHRRYIWRAGEAMVFESQAIHAAWNRGSQRRVCLIVDFKRDSSRPFIADHAALAPYRHLF